MTINTARKMSIGFGEEATYGTQASSINLFYGKVNPFNSSFENILEETGGIDNDAEIQGQVRTEKRIQFDMTFSHLANGRILKHIFGQQTQALAGGVYTHTLTPLNSAFQPSLTCELTRIQTANQVTRYLGMVIDQATFNWTQGGHVSLQTNVIVQNISTGSTIISSASSSGATYFKAKATELKVDGGSVIEHNQGSLAITKNHEATPEIDGVDNDLITRPKCGRFNYTLTFSLDQTDLTFVTALNNGANHTVTLKFIKGANDYILFTMVGKFTRLSEPIDLGNNTLIEEITFVPKNITCEVKDGISWA